MYAEILKMSLIPSNLLLWIVLLECDGEKWLLKMMFINGVLLMCSVKNHMLFCFLLLPKAEVSWVTGETYSGIIGAGSGAVGLGIGVYAG